MAAATSKCEPVKVRKFLFFGLLSIVVFRASAYSQSDSTGPKEAMSRAQKSVWASIEYGGYSEDSFHKSGNYQRVSLEIPFNKTLGLFVIADRVKYESYHSNFGLGLRIVWLQAGKFDFFAAPSLYVGDNLGVMMPTAVDFRFLNDVFRVQSTLSYRYEGKPGPAGHSSLSLFTFSGGLGIALDKVLPGNNK
ncbi:MAG TPA: hypothetical protein VL633_01300 [Bacteroidota bacterium]|nr:hypothetical protein [Bacteroidota bacterium]